MEYNSRSHGEPLRESIFVLTERVLLLQLIVGLASILINLALVLLISTGASSSFLIIALSLGNIIVQTLDALVLIYLVLQWVNTSYVIKPDEIIVRRGITHIRTSVYKTERIESVAVEQSLLGKLLNYGTLKFHDPYVKEDIYVANITNPHKYADIAKIFKP
ncbi:MAG: Membrane-flanked domain [Candidatus Saccharibacteria bacterium]|nr:Membrane-flanked domain [Candidatus Saccharibacteria bacterium]